jgi:hypothetical protein
MLPHAVMRRGVMRKTGASSWSISGRYCGYFTLKS